jgi:hypothetical protein
MSEFPLVSAGDDVSGLVTSARWLNHVTHGRAGAAAGRPGVGGGAPDEATLRIQVLNDAGEAIEVPFPILRLTDPVFTVDDDANTPFNGVQFRGDKPDAETGANFVVVQGHLAAGEAREAVLVGPCWAKVDVTDEAHTQATSIDGDAEKLASATSGAKILWKEAGTGEKWAVVFLGASSAATTLRWGQAVGAVSASTGWAEADWGAGSVQFYDDAGVADGDPVDVVNKYWTTFPDTASICVDTSNDTIVAGTCETAPEEE